VKFWQILVGRKRCRKRER